MQTAHGRRAFYLESLSLRYATHTLVAYPTPRVYLATVQEVLGDTKLADAIDTAFERFKALRSEFEATLGNSPNESDTRFQVIDRLLMEVLGWPREAIHTEVPTKTGYADYLLTGKNDRGVLVVEAKRSGVLVSASASKSKSTPKLSGPTLRSLGPGIQQAFGYASSKGVPIATLTDGAFWLFFRASRGDGIAPSDGSAVCFPNLDAIRDNFAQFFELGSPDGINSRANLVHLNRAEGVLATPREHQYIILPPENAKLIRSSDVTRDARLLFRQFFARLTNSQDKEMLRQCFAETSQSRQADQDMRKIVEKILNSTTVLDSERGLALQEEIERTIASGSSESVLIIGNKGSGKSTFIDRFFSVSLPPELRSRCVVARADLENFSGDHKLLIPWAIDQLVAQLEKEVCTNDPPSYEDLQGIYFREYQSWMLGSYKYLYESNKTEFKIKFGDHIERLRKSAPENYLRLLLNRAFFSLKRLPCLVFDNTDQFDAQTQDSIYQMAHALGSQAPSLSIVPITDRTVWRLSKAGSLQSYSARSFYLPPPDVKAVLQKRVAFVKDKLSLEPEEALNYFSRKGFRVGLDDLTSFATAIERVFVETDFVSGLIGRLGNYDIRRMLELAERIFMSPEIKIDDVLKSAFGGQRLTDNTERTHRALIRGEYDRFSENENSYILNMFWTDPDNPASPLLAYYILSVLRHRATTAAKDTESQHWSVSVLLPYFEGCGADKEACLTVLNRLFDWRLIDELDPTTQVIGEHSRVAMRECGEAHLHLCLHSPIYLHEMALSTGLNSRSVMEDLRRLGQKPNDRYKGRPLQAGFVRYVMSLDAARLAVPRGKEYSALRDARSRFANSAPSKDRRSTETANRMSKRQERGNRYNRPRQVKRKK